MSDNFKEIGLGILTGNYQGWNAVMVTQKFARSGSNSFLTGVIYTDAILNDDFYTVGEGLGGITVRATRQADNQVFSTTTFGSGGYQLALGAGTYNVQFSGGTLGQTVSRTVTIGSINVKVDLATDQLTTLPPVPSNTINGTANSETLTGTAANETLNGFAGNDTLRAGAGNDTLLGGADNDILIGINTSSTTPGRNEVDILNGGSGRDRFVLGNTTRIFYDDGVVANGGNADYALIQDFKLTESDQIQLRGTASNYVLGAAPSGLAAGTGIFLKTSGANELIGIIQGISGLSLTSSAFRYV
jgi:serralysin